MLEPKDVCRLVKVAMFSSHYGHGTPCDPELLAKTALFGSQFPCTQENIQQVTEAIWKRIDDLAREVHNFH